MFWSTTQDLGHSSTTPHACTGDCYGENCARLNSLLEALLPKVWKKKKGPSSGGHLTSPLSQYEPSCNPPEKSAQLPDGQDGLNLLQVLLNQQILHKCVLQGSGHTLTLDVQGLTSTKDQKRICVSQIKQSPFQQIYEYIYLIHIYIYIYMYIEWL